MVNNDATKCCVTVEIPKPIVKRPRLLKYAGVDQGIRTGRGFSLGELKAANISEELAKELGIPIDRRRRSVHEWNVENLRKFVEQISELI
ncbi:MAG TPA: 50S ribosomal protein L13e, partial [Ignisphaera sp.]|nr:50S ribosomal protein L13e [Ignisphaera sp.]